MAVYLALTARLTPDTTAYYAAPTVPAMLAWLDTYFATARLDEWAYTLSSDPFEEVELAAYAIIEVSC